MNLSKKYTEKIKRLFMHMRLICEGRFQSPPHQKAHIFFARAFIEVNNLYINKIVLGKRLYSGYSYLHNGAFIETLYV